MRVLSPISSAADSNTARIRHEEDILLVTARSAIHLVQETLEILPRPTVRGGAKVSRVRARIGLVRCCRRGGCVRKGCSQGTGLGWADAGASHVPRVAGTAHKEQRLNGVLLLERLV